MSLAEVNALNVSLTKRSRMTKMSDCFGENGPICPSRATSEVIVDSASFFRSSLQTVAQAGISASDWRTILQGRRDGE